MRRRDFMRAVLSCTVAAAIGGLPRQVGGPVIHTGGFVSAPHFMDTLDADIYRLACLIHPVPFKIANATGKSHAQARILDCIRYQANPGSAVASGISGRRRG